VNSIGAVRPSWSPHRPPPELAALPISRTAGCWRLRSKWRRTKARSSPGFKTGAATYHAHFTAKPLCQKPRTKGNSDETLCIGRSYPHQTHQTDTALAVRYAAQLKGSGVSASSGPRRADFFQCESDCSGSAEEDERVPRDRCPEHREVQAKDAERPEPGADYP